MNDQQILGVSCELGVRYATFEVELLATPDYARMINRVVDDLHEALEFRGATRVRLVETQRVVMPLALMQMKPLVLQDQQAGLRVAALFSYDSILDCGAFEWPRWSGS